MQKKRRGEGRGKLASAKCRKMVVDNKREDAGKRRKKKAFSRPTSEIRKRLDFAPTL